MFNEGDEKFPSPYKFTKMKRFLLQIVMSIVFCFSIAAQTHYTNTNLNLREGPGTTYRVITTLPKGTNITINADCSENWVYVEYDGYSGYLRTSYLSKKNHHQSLKQSEITLVDYVSKRYYTNTYGNRVQCPTYYCSVPTNATAVCCDGTYSFSQSRRGTCSHHGGVAEWQ